MATTAPCATSSNCEEKLRLNDAIWSAVREVLELNDVPDARLGDSPDLARLVLARKLAIQRHDDAKRAFLLHTWKHGC